MNKEIKAKFEELKQWEEKFLIAKAEIEAAFDKFWERERQLKVCEGFVFTETDDGTEYHHVEEEFKFFREELCKKLFREGKITQEEWGELEN